MKNEGVRKRFEKKFEEHDAVLADARCRIALYQAEIAEEERRIAEASEERRKMMTEMGYELREEFRERVVGMTVEGANALDKTLRVWPAKVNNRPRMFAQHATTGTTCLLVETINDRIVKTFEYGPPCSDLGPI